MVSVKRQNNGITEKRSINKICSSILSCYLPLKVFELKMFIVDVAGAVIIIICKRCFVVVVVVEKQNKRCFS